MTPPVIPERDPLEELKALRQGGSDPLDELKKTPRGTGIRPVHSKFTADQLTARANRVVSSSTEAEDTPGTGESAMRALVAAPLTVAEGFPGGERAAAGYATAASRFTDNPMDYGESREAIRSLTDDGAPWYKPSAAKVARFAGALPTMAVPGMAAVRSPVAAGAIYGAADQAGSADEESLGERAARTAAGGAAGALIGGAASRVLNVAQRSGLTDLIATGAEKVGDFATRHGASSIGDAANSFAQSIGTRGAANSLLGDRQAILDQLQGSEKSAAQTMADHIENYRTEAGRLYGVARQDTKVVTDPRVVKLLGDQNVQKALQLARGASTGPAAIPAVTGQHGPATALPTPEELAIAKRTLDAIARRKYEIPGIDQAEAARLMPIVNDLRNALHDASDSWAQADAFYSRAKGFEDAFTRAYGSQIRPTPTGLEPRKLKSPDAIQSWADASPDLSIKVARRSGVQAGAAQRMAEAVRSAPLGETPADIVKAANGTFAPSVSAANVRRLAFAHPEAARAFSELIGQTEAKGVTQAAQFTEPESVMRPWSWGRARNPLSTARGTTTRYDLSARLADPQTAGGVMRNLAASKEGQRMLEAMLRSGVLGSEAAQPLH